jgi:hypothetical protein
MKLLIIIDRQQWLIKSCESLIDLRRRSVVNVARCTEGWFAERESQGQRPSPGLAIALGVYKARIGILPDYVKLAIRIGDSYRLRGCTGLGKIEWC